MRLRISTSDCASVGVVSVVFTHIAVAYSNRKYMVRSLERYAKNQSRGREVVLVGRTMMQIQCLGPKSQSCAARKLE